MQKTAAKFANHKNELGWETLAQHKLIAQMDTILQFLTVIAILDNASHPLP